MQKNVLAVCAAAMAVLSQGAHAQPFGSSDPVSMAMGGTGVALPQPTTANLFNPAHLASFSAARDEDFAIGIAAGGRAYDEDDVLDVLDDVADDFDRIEQLATAIEGGAITAENFAALAEATRQLDRNLTEASGKHAQLELGANLLGNGNTGGWGVGLMLNAHATVGARVVYRDSAYLQNLADQAEAQDPTIDYDETSLTSEAQAVGAAFGEIGLTVAKRFTLGERTVSVGVTPKYMEIETINYSTLIQETDQDDFDGDQYTKSYSDFNLDVGVLTELGRGLYAGLTVKNLIPREYDTVADPQGRSYTIKLDPQARVGMGYDGNWYRLAIDADLTENDPVAFEEGTRFVGVGAELDAFGWAQLRAGYRHNTVDSDRSVASLGLGLSPFKVVHLDIAVASNGDEVGGSAQLALTF